MREVLFDGKNNVTKQDVIEKMNHYIDKAEKGMKVFKSDKVRSLNIAKELRIELEKENKNNRLKRIEDFYKDNKLFYHYASAIHESVAATVGRLTYNNLYSFLYDVADYMRYYKPKDDR